MNKKDLITGLGLEKPAHIVKKAQTTFPKREFKGWHKPRKQFVRKRQWIAHFEEHLIDEIDLSERSLKYFSFPGEDMLDIRVLAKFCEEKNIRIACLGFDASIVTTSQQQQTEINISRSEISSVLKEGSVITSDKFVSLSNEKSQGFNYFRNHGPFDLINLDFCNSIFSKDRVENHNALRNICNYQIQNRKEPWLLFLTTRADKKSINPSDLERYWHNINTNMNELDQFSNQLQTVISNKLKINDESELDLRSIKKLPAGCFARLFAIGIGKWLLKLMMNGKPFWPLEMLHGCWYRVETSKVPNMLSLAFKFVPHPEVKEDRSGLAQPVKSEPPDERKYAMEILNKTGDLQDIDELMFHDGSLLNQMITESSALLKSARYPEGDYEEWAQKKLVRRFET